MARTRGIGLHGLWLALTLGASRLDRRARAAGAPEGATLGLTVVGWYALLRAFERRRPFRADWDPPAAEKRADGGFFLTSTVAALTGQAVGAGLAGRLRRRAGRVERLGIAGGIVASLLTSELVHYSLHRLGHEWAPAWRFHSVHHRPRRLHIFNATRFHPAEQALEGVLEGLALGVAGFGPAQRVTHATARATYGQLQHGNIDIDSGPLDHVFATPDLHRWHHSDDPAEGNANYGAVLSVYDRLLGTFFRPARAFDARLGIGA